MSSPPDTLKPTQGCFERTARENTKGCRMVILLRREIGGEDEMLFKTNAGAKDAVDFL